MVPRRLLKTCLDSQFSVFSRPLLLQDYFCWLPIPAAIAEGMVARQHSGGPLLGCFRAVGGLLRFVGYFGGWGVYHFGERVKQQYSSH